MLVQMFTIFDSKTEEFKTPFYAKTKGEAIRMFSDTAQDKQGLIGQHPADFTLFHLGEFCTDSCDIIKFAAPISVGIAVEFVTAEIREVENG